MPESFTWLLLDPVPSKGLIMNKYMSNCWNYLGVTVYSSDWNYSHKCEGGAEHFLHILQRKCQCISTDKERYLSSPAKAGIVRSRPCPTWNMPHWKAVTTFFNAISFNKLLLHSSCFLSSSSSFRQTCQFCSSHLKSNLSETESGFRSHRSSQAHTEAPGKETFNPWLITRAKLPWKKGPWLTRHPAATVLHESENHYMCNSELIDLTLWAFP